MLTPRALELIEQRGLEPEIVTLYGVESVARAGGEWIKFPYLLGADVVNAKYRTLEGEKRFSQEPDGKCTVWNFNCLVDATLSNQRLIITEGEFDALAAIQAGFDRTVSVPNGAPPEKIGEKETRKYAYLDDLRSILRDTKEIVLAFDGDTPGSNLTHDIALRLGKERCKWLTYPKRKDGNGRCKDLNETLKEYGVKGVQETVSRAQWLQTDGVYDILETPLEPEEKVHEIGFDGLDRHYKIRKGDFAVVTGIPSHGKSSFLNDIACRMAVNHGWRTAFASFEQSPRRDHLRNLRAWYLRKERRFCSSEEIASADAWISKHFRVMLPSDAELPTLDWLIDKIVMAVIQHRCDMVIIDPWNEMDHLRASGESLTEYTGRAIKELKRLAGKFHIHLIVAAHPAKMRSEGGILEAPGLYDISDSAHWANKPDVGLSIHRPNKQENLTEIHVKKIRYRGVIGEEGIIRAHYLPDERRYQWADIAEAAGQRY